MRKQNKHRQSKFQNHKSEEDKSLTLEFVTFFQIFNPDMRSRSRSVERRRRRSTSRDRKPSISRSQEHKYRKEDQKDRRSFQNNERRDERKRSDQECPEKRKMTCYNCQQEGHMSRECPTGGGRRPNHTRSNVNSQPRIKSEPRTDESSKYGKPEVKKEDDDEDSNEPEQVNMAVSGKLLEDTNVFNGVVIK